jgi:hypothetical protein
VAQSPDAGHHPYLGNIHPTAAASATLAPSDYALLRQFAKFIMSLCTAILVSAGLAAEPAALIAHGGVCEGGRVRSCKADLPLLGKYYPRISRDRGPRERARRRSQIRERGAAQNRLSDCALGHRRGLARHASASATAAAAHAGSGSTWMLLQILRQLIGPAHQLAVQENLRHGRSARCRPDALHAQVIAQIDGFEGDAPLVQQLLGARAIRTAWTCEHEAGSQGLRVGTAMPMASVNSSKGSATNRMPSAFSERCHASMTNGSFTERQTTSSIPATRKSLSRATKPGTWAVLQVGESTRQRKQDHAAALEQFVFRDALDHAIAQFCQLHVGYLGPLTRRSFAHSRLHLSSGSGTQATANRLRVVCRHAIPHCGESDDWFDSHAVHIRPGTLQQ